MCKISFLLPNLVAFLCYTVNIHLVKWLMRCDTKRAIWWDLYNKHISIFCIKHLSTIFRTLQVDKWKTKRFSHFARKMPLNLVPKFDFVWIVSCSWSYHTILLLMFVAEKVLLLLVISLTAKAVASHRMYNSRAETYQRSQRERWFSYIVYVSAGTANPVFLKHGF